MSDPILVERATLGGIPYWQKLGIEVLEAEQGYVRLRLPFLADNRMGGGADTMHGGAIASLVDAASGAVTRTLPAPSEPPLLGGATTDLNVSYLNAGRGDLYAQGRVLREGGRLAFVGVEVRDEAGTLVAIGRATFVLRRAER